MTRRIAGLVGSGKDEKEEKAAGSKKGQCVFKRGKETKQPPDAYAPLSDPDPPPAYQEKEQAVVSSG